MKCRFPNASQVTDGFALGVTLLMVLTGRSAVGLIEACDEALSDNPSLAPDIADATAAWPDAVTTEVVKVVEGCGCIPPRS